MMEHCPTVTIVDDDESVRRAFARLLRASGYAVRTFASGPELLDDDSGFPLCGPGCLLLDIRMPVLGGLELHAMLKENGTAPAVVFMTGHGDLETRALAMRSGAVDCLLKPFTDRQLLDAIERALMRDANAENGGESEAMGAAR
jgi:FixJ family two-component response regulator